MMELVTTPVIFIVGEAIIGSLNVATILRLS